MAKDEVIVEVDCPQAENLMFPPLYKMLRGKYSRMKLHPGVSKRDTPLLACPDIPGLHICVDPTAKTLAVIDPLGFPSNRGLLTQINVIFKADGQPEARPVDNVEVKNATDKQIATWLHHMRRMVEAGHGKVIKGRLPEKSDPLAQVKFFDPSRSAKKTLGEMQEAGEVPA